MLSKVSNELIEDNVVREETERMYCGRKVPMGLGSVSG